MRHDSLRTSTLAAALAALVLSSAVTPVAHAAAENVPAAADDADLVDADRETIHVRDEDPLARYELRDGRGEVTTWVGDRDVTARRGRITLRVMHAGRLDEQRFDLLGETDVRGRIDHPGRRAAGVAMVIGGSVAMTLGLLLLAASRIPCGDCEPSPSFQQEHDRVAQRSEILGLVGLMVGAGVLVGGIAFTASSRPSLSTHTREPSSAAPTRGGGTFAIVGTF